MDCPRQSFVDTVTLDGGIIDMSKNENSSVTVNDLSGSGIVKMRLNTGDRDQSDMLYVTGSLEAITNCKLPVTNLILTKLQKITRCALQP